MKEQPSIYSKVIFKKKNDLKNKDLLNSYNYKKTSPSRMRKWSPDISFEDRFKKKRSREEKYINQIHPEDRPLLLIKKKHEYQGLGTPIIKQSPSQTESYYKVSQNTLPVEDISQEIGRLEHFIRRHTLHHVLKDQQEEIKDLNTVIKVEGKEFLPKGFIELDPLLYKNEYEFQSEVDEKVFDKEQRKLKQLRRKQYEQRKDDKIRDVTIYVMDENKSKVLQFLNKWYKKYRRKMNEEELEYVASLLNVDPQQLERLQELFFQKQEILENNQKANIKNLKTMPKAMKDYLCKPKFSQVDPRYLNYAIPYKPSYLNGYFRANKQNLSQTLDVASKGDLDKIHQSLSRSYQKKDYERNNPFQRLGHTSQNPSKTEIKLPKNRTKKNTQQNQFDQEIDKIIADLQSGREDGEKGEVQEMPKKVQQNINDYIDFDKKQIAAMPKRFSQVTKNKKTIKVKQKLKPLLVGNEYFYQTVSDIKKPKSRKVVIETRDDQGIKIDQVEIPNEKITNFYTNEATLQEPQFTGDNRHKISVYNDNGVVVHEISVYPKINLIQEEKIEEEMKRPNFRGQREEEMDCIKTIKLPPIQFEGREYHQIIEKIEYPEDDEKQFNLLTVDENNNVLDSQNLQPEIEGEKFRSVLGKEGEDFVIYTLNEDGRKISSYKIELANPQMRELPEENTLGDMYQLIFKPIPLGERTLQFQADLFDKKKFAEVQLKDDLDHDLVRQQIPRTCFDKPCYCTLIKIGNDSYFVLKNKDEEIQFKYQIPQEYYSHYLKRFDEEIDLNDEEQERRASVLLKNNPDFQFSSYQIRPILIGDKYYSQTVNILNDEEGQPQAVLITQDEEGSVVDVSDVDPSLLTLDYYNKIKSDQIDQKGKREAYLITFNDKNEEINELIFDEKILEKEQSPVKEYLEEIVVQEEDPEVLYVNKAKDDVICTQNVIDSDKQKKMTQKNDYYEKLLKMFIKDKKRSFAKPQKEFLVRNKANTIAVFPDINQMNREEMQPEENQETEEEMEEEVEEVQKEEIKPDKRQTKKSILEEYMDDVHKDDEDQDKFMDHIRNQILKKSQRLSDLKKKEEEEKKRKAEEEKMKNKIQKFDSFKTKPNELISKKLLEMEEKVPFNPTQKNKEEHQNYSVDDDQINFVLDEDRKSKDESVKESFKDSLRKIIEKEKKGMPDELFKNIKEKIGVDTNEQLLEDFYQFCLNLANDSRYKESVMFATLFYYFLEKKKKLKKIPQE